MLEAGGPCGFAAPATGRAFSVDMSGACPVIHVYQSPHIDLEARGLIAPVAGGRWCLTDEGRARAAGLVVDMRAGDWRARRAAADAAGRANGQRLAIDLFCGGGGSSAPSARPMRSARRPTPSAGNASCAIGPGAERNACFGRRRGDRDPPDELPGDTRDATIRLDAPPPHGAGRLRAAAPAVVGSLAHQFGSTES